MLTHIVIISIAGVIGLLGAITSPQGFWVGVFVGAAAATSGWKLAKARFIRAYEAEIAKEAAEQGRSNALAKAAPTASRVAAPVVGLPPVPPPVAPPPAPQAAMVHSPVASPPAPQAAVQVTAAPAREPRNTKSGPARSPQRTTPLAPPLDAFPPLDLPPEEAGMLAAPPH